MEENTRPLNGINSTSRRYTALGVAGLGVLDEMTQEAPPSFAASPRAPQDGHPDEMFGKSIATPSPRSTLRGAQLQSAHDVQPTPGSSDWTPMLPSSITIPDSPNSPSAGRGEHWLFGGLLNERAHDLECGCSSSAPSDGTSLRHTCDEVVELMTRIKKLEAELEKNKAVNPQLFQNITSRSTSELQQPRESKKEPRVCRHCGRDFKYPKDLRRHEMIHEPKKHHCNYPGCNAEFVLQKDLMRHTISVHQQTESIACPHCNFKSKRKDNMLRHIRNSHGETLHT